MPNQDHEDLKGAIDGKGERVWLGQAHLAAAEKAGSTLLVTDRGMFDVRKLDLDRTIFTGDPDLDEMLRMCIRTTATKGAEYTIGSSDRLHNFRTVAETVDQPMEKVWFTYFYKHYSAVAAYIRNGCQVQSNEPIAGRIMDCVVYLLLFHKMVKEIEERRKTALLDKVL